MEGVSGRVTATLAASSKVRVDSLPPKSFTAFIVTTGRPFWKPATKGKVASSSITVERPLNPLDKFKISAPSIVTNNWNETKSLYSSLTCAVNFTLSPAATTVSPFTPRNTAFSILGFEGVGHSGHSLGLLTSSFAHERSNNDDMNNTYIFFIFLKISSLTIMNDDINCELPQDPLSIPHVQMSVPTLFHKIPKLVEPHN